MYTLALYCWYPVGNGKRCSYIQVRNCGDNCTWYFLYTQMADEQTQPKKVDVVAFFSLGKAYNIKQSKSRRGDTRCQQSSKIPPTKRQAKLRASLLRRTDETRSYTVRSTSTEYEYGVRVRSTSYAYSVVLRGTRLRSTEYSGTSNGGTYVLYGRLLRVKRYFR
jgi:hypothetical protein